MGRPLGPSGGRPGGGGTGLPDGLSSGPRRTVGRPGRPGAGGRGLARGDGRCAGGGPGRHGPGAGARKGTGHRRAGRRRSRSRAGRGGGGRGHWRGRRPRRGALRTIPGAVVGRGGAGAAGGGAAATVFWPAPWSPTPGWRRGGGHGRQPGPTTSTSRPRPGRKTPPWRTWWPWRPSSAGRAPRAGPGGATPPRRPCGGPRSACASSMEDEWLLTPIPRERASSSPSLLVRPSSLAQLIDAESSSASGSLCPWFLSGPGVKPAPYPRTSGAVRPHASPSCACNCCTSAASIDGVRGPGRKPGACAPPGRGSPRPPGRSRPPARGRAGPPTAPRPATGRFGSVGGRRALRHPTRFARPVPRLARTSTHVRTGAPPPPGLLRRRLRGRLRLARRCTLAPRLTLASPPAGPGAGRRRSCPPPGADHSSADMASPPSAGFHTISPRLVLDPLSLGPLLVGVAGLLLGELGLALDVDAPAGQPGGRAGRSGPPCRWRGRAGSRSRSPWPCPSPRRGGPRAPGPEPRAFWMSSTGSSENGTTSTRSPRSSLVTMRTREPRAPTQAPDRVDVGVVRPHGDLGAVAGLARRRLDLHHAGGDLGHLELEEPLDQPGVGAADHDLGTLGGLADLDDVRLEACAVLVALVGDLLRLGQQRLHLAEVEQCVPVVGLLDDPGDDVTLATRRTPRTSCPARPRGSAGGSPAWPSGRRCARSRRGCRPTRG